MRCIQTVYAVYGLGARVTVIPVYYTRVKYYLTTDTTHGVSHRFSDKSLNLWC